MIWENVYLSDDWLQIGEKVQKKWTYLWKRVQSAGTVVLTKLRSTS